MRKYHHVRSLFGLASGGVYHAGPVTGSAVRSYRTFSPLPFFAHAPKGGLFSVALSVGSLPPGVTRRRISMKPGLSSLHRRSYAERLPGLLTSYTYGKMQLVFKFIRQLMLLSYEEASLKSVPFFHWPVRPVPAFQRFPAGNAAGMP